ncbi:AraC family transcriptional regulator ligand-binding domain-containing protein [Pseudomonas nicosulfuronedens]
MRPATANHQTAPHARVAAEGDVAAAAHGQPGRSVLGSVLAGCNPNELRTGPVRALPQVITALGGNPQCVFKAADIDLSRFVSDHEQRLDYVETARLFATAIGHTRCPHLGMLVGRNVSLDYLGPVGQLMRSAATVGDALHDLVTHAQLHDRGSALMLLPLTGQFSLLGYVIQRHDLADPKPLIDTAVMIGLQIMRELLGPTWTPVRVQLAYRKPADSVPYLRAFGCPVRFNANVSGMVIANQQLGQTLGTANPQLHQSLLGVFSAAAGLTLAEQISHRLHPLLLAGEARSEQIANRVGLHIRTLHRRLEAEGTHLQQLVTASRQSLAFQLLANTNLPVSLIAQSLQYQDPNAFSRAFRTWTGSSPQQWRNASQGVAYADGSGSAHQA